MIYLYLQNISGIYLRIRYSQILYIYIYINEIL